MSDAVRVEGHNRIAEISVPATVLYLATAKHSTSVRVDLFLRGVQCRFSS